MSGRLAERVRHLEQSRTMTLAAAAQRLQGEGADIINLTAGETDFPTPSHVAEAAHRAIESGYTRYTPNEGAPDLVDAVVRKFRRQNRLAFTPDQILVSSGAKHCLANALTVLCNPGDEVLLFHPYWVSYPAMVRLAGGVPVVVPTDARDSYLPDADALRRAITPRSRVLILNTPGNPSGTVVPQPLLEKLARVATEHGLTILSDEIYEHVVYDGHTHVSIGALPGAEPFVVTVSGVSKGYAMTGWRIGFMGGPRECIAAARIVQSQTTSGANSIAQKAACAALDGSAEILEQMRTELSRRRDIALRGLTGVPGVSFPVPGGALYLFVDVAGVLGRTNSTGTVGTSADVARYLLEHAGVAVVPGDAFGDSTCIRISFAGPPGPLAEGVSRIARALRELQEGR